MTIRNAAFALLTAGALLAPAAARSQDADYVMQVKVYNQSKRPVFVGTEFKTAWKKVDIGGNYTYQWKITTSECKNPKELELNIADSNYPLDSSQVYAYTLYLYEWNGADCYFSYIGGKSIDDNFVFDDGSEIDTGEANVTTRKATFKRK